MPANDLSEVKRLINKVETREFFGVVLKELQNKKLDTDDLVSIIVDDLGVKHWFKSQKTEKYYPGTTSDYYGIWVDECNCSMFIKLLIANDGLGDRVVVTSFKKDTHHA